MTLPNWEASGIGALVVAIIWAIAEWVRGRPRPKGVR